MHFTHELMDVWMLGAGDNFGVGVQEEALSELSKSEDAAFQGTRLPLESVH
jgi:hypothetical protein